MANISISQMNTRAEANLSDLHEVAYADEQSSTGYASGKMTMEVMANAIVNDFAYQSLGNKTVKGAIEDAEVTVDTALDPTSTNAVQNRVIAHELAGGNTQASGDVVTITDGSNLALTNATTTLTPIQDLHGYEYPWVGGAGKNLANTEGTNTSNGYVYGQFVSYQGGYSGVGTFDGFVTEYIPIQANTTYNLSGISGGSPSICFYDSNKEYIEGIKYNSRTSFSFTAANNVVYCRLSVTNTQKDTIQLELGSTATAYEPYSNICPITGYDDVSVTRTGVNQWDEEWVYGYWDVSNGQFVSGGYSWIASKNYIPCIPTTTYYANCDNTLTSTGFIILMYDKDKNYIGVYNNGTNIKNTTFTTIENCYYLTFYIAARYSSYPISINYPSTITTYQPYQGQNVTLTFDNTVYSGVIDWCTGVVTVDKAMEVFDGSEDEGWNNYGSGSASAFAMKTTKIQGLTYTQLISTNYLKILSNDTTWGNYDGWISIGSAGNTNSVVTGIKSITTVADWKTYLSNNNLQVLYELSTPTTIQLTPTQLTTLAGYNTIYTDVGNISIAYQPNNVIAECKEYTDNAIPTVDSELDDTSLNPIANKPVAEAIADIVGDISDIDSNIEGSKQLTTTGNVITVSDSAATYLEELEVEVEPIQDLHGYDYPWVGGAGKNIFDFESWLTARGVTYTKQGNAYTLTANSLVGSENYWEFSDTPINVTLSTTVENGTATNVGFRLKNTVNDEVSTKGSYITMVANAVYIDWTTSGTVTITGPQIEAGSTATSYEPYSNVCPISGYDECEVTRTGKNLVEGKLDGYSIDSVGKIVTSGQTTNYSVQYAKITQGVTYTLTTGAGFVGAYYTNVPTAGATSYNNARVDVSNTTFTAPIDGYVAFRTSLNYATPQCEQGATATTYEPYQGQTYTVSFNDTVYSGTLDVTTGVLTVDKAITRRTEFDYKSSATANYVYRLGTISKSDIKNITSTISDKFMYKNIYSVNESGFYLSEGSTTDEIYVGLTLESGADTLAKANTWLTNNGGYIDFLYELATPQTIQLTPQQLQMLKGYNTVTTDANGGMTIKYQPDNVVGEIKAYASRLYDDILDRLEALSE